VIVLILALITMWDSAAQQRAARYAATEETGDAEGSPAAVAGTAFPVPPMDLPHYHGVGVENQTQASSKEVTGA
jgi:hypothetical protein